MPEATITSKGQITIPAEIRHSLGLAAQDRVVFTRLMDGTVVMRAKTRSVTGLRGLLKQPPGAPEVKIEAMKLGRD